eukprot:3029847-Pleurochrysis_carterae.AAC.4
MAEAEERDSEWLERRAERPDVTSRKYWRYVPFGNESGSCCVMSVIRTSSLAPTVLPSPSTSHRRSIDPWSCAFHTLQLWST